MLRNWRHYCALAIPAAALEMMLKEGDLTWDPYAHSCKDSKEIAEEI